MILFDEDAQKTPEWAAVKKACAEAIKKRWGEDALKDQDFLRKIRMPWRPAEEKAKYAGFTKGKVFINPWSKDRPGLVDGRRKDITAPSDVWAGQIVRASVQPFAYPRPGVTLGNQGVLLLLNNIQVTKANMPRMDGRKAADEEFGDVDNGEADDGESPF